MHAALVCHDDGIYLPAVVESFQGRVPATLFLNERPWHGQPGDFEKVKLIAERLGVEVILGCWDDEAEHRQAVLTWARAQEIRRLLIPDTDEVLSPELLDSLFQLAAIELADQVHVEMDTYWKSPEYVIRPRERLRPVILVDPAAVQHRHIREYQGQRPLVLSAAHGVLHHLSYAGPDERIRRKVDSWSHRDELLPDWLDRVWDAWDENRTLGNLHPTHPEAYGFTERIPVPDVLRTAMAAYLEAHGGTDPLHRAELEPITPWPSISVVIPLYGGPDDLKHCLDSLQDCEDLLAQILVVDDASPDDAPAVAENRTGVTLLRNATNLGFAATCNHGLAHAIGEHVLFLNSDTRLSRPALIRLVESIQASGSIAAAGPYSNEVGHFQRTRATYTNPDHHRLFAEDFALRRVEDRETDMLVGFCLLVRKSALDEVGPFDPGFGIGLFEDNDLCYRLRRKGYRLVISGRSFVHHEANRSLERSPEDKFAAFARNERYYRSKWQRDLDTGFASHLAGTRAERIEFNPTREPERLDRELTRLVKRADISLFMIVKNEERVLDACLTSAKPFFTQIVILDTGSTDRTVEIAESHGAEVHHFAWCDDFAAARNASMAHAKGKWLFWMDADDTLPWTTGEALVRAAAEAPRDVNGFFMRVRFVNDDPTYGTIVDHVKLFRRLPSLAWKHRIHEQILPSLREHPGNIFRLDAEVLHSGYDTSEEGQARKRERDEKLLFLDLEENPDHPFTLFNIGMTRHYTNAHEEAIEWLQRCIAQCREGETILRKAYAMLAASYRYLGNLNEALETCEAGLRACPGDPELLFRLGQILMETDRLVEAVNTFRKVLGADISGHFSSIDLGILGPKLHIHLALTLMRLGNYREAKHHFQRAIQQNPADLTIVFELFRAAVASGDRATAVEMIQHVETCEGRTHNWARMVQDLETS
ncbi:MAG: glycosyltransferase [Methanoregulaceae archaeon]|nr:glycosyltransferase [Methanoregulaceae archaeon]